MTNTGGAQSRSAKDERLTSLIMPLNESQLMNEIFSSGLPTPKAKPVVQQSPINNYHQEQSPIIQKIAPQIATDAFVNLIPDEESSRFSDSRDRSIEKNDAKKEQLKQKLAQLKEKLAKAKSVAEKAKLLEKERDKEIIHRKKAEMKNESKRKEQEAKQDRKIHTEPTPKIPTPQAKIIKPKPESSPTKKKDIQKHPAIKPAQQQNLDPNANEEVIDFNNKLHLVDELARRWWYALPAWPPADFDYNTELAKRNFELVEPNKLREESKGFKRVVQVEAYPGVFKDSDGKLHDLRPQETMPSLQNFQKKSVSDLQSLLKKAYEEQRRQITEMLEGKLPSYDHEIELEINESLNKKLKRFERCV